MAWQVTSVGGKDELLYWIQHHTFESLRRGLAMRSPAVACDVARAILVEAISPACAGRDDRLGPPTIYTLSLLGFHRDTEAFGLLVDTACLPGGGEAILGDAVTEMAVRFCVRRAETTPTGR